MHAPVFNPGPGVNAGLIAEGHGAELSMAADSLIRLSRHARVAGHASTGGLYVRPARGASPVFYVGRFPSWFAAELGVIETSCTEHPGIARQQGPVYAQWRPGTGGKE